MVVHSSAERFTRLALPERRASILLHPGASKHSFLHESTSYQLVNSGVTLLNSNLFVINSLQAKDNTKARFTLRTSLLLPPSKGFEKAGAQGQCSRDQGWLKRRPRHNLQTPAEQELINEVAFSWGRFLLCFPEISIRVLVEHVFRRAVSIQLQNDLASAILDITPAVQIGIVFDPHTRPQPAFLVVQYQVAQISPKLLTFSNLSPLRGPSSKPRKRLNLRPSNRSSSGHERTGSSSKNQSNTRTE